jgi:hypothetical protein
VGPTDWIAVAVMMGLMGSVNAAADESGSFTIPVMVMNEVGIQDQTVRLAQAETARIFKAAGITLTWLRSGTPSKRTLIIKIATVPPDQKGRNQNALGVAPSSKETRGRVAWLYYHRIEGLARLSQLEVSKLLGHVMAHEMGHLLLPYGSHALSGLMREGWDAQQTRLASTSELTFAPDQAATIRARLQRAHESLPNP